MKSEFDWDHQKALDEHIAGERKFWVFIRWYILVAILVIIFSGG